MKISKRDQFLLIFLVIILVGVCYYLMFYKPLQEELASIDTQCTEVEQQTTIAISKAKKMNSMQEELDEILSRPESEITEIAPYDNAKVVMSQLNAILSSTENYDLKFHDPSIQDDGTVRRTVSMTFECENYENARIMIEALTESHWRCLINGISIKAKEEQYIPATTESENDELTEGEVTSVVESSETATSTETEITSSSDSDTVQVMRGAVSVTATITFFESTKIS